MLDDDRGADINDGIRDDDKADGATGIEVISRLRPGAAGSIDIKLTAATPRPGLHLLRLRGREGLDRKHARRFASRRRLAAQGLRPAAVRWFVSEDVAADDDSGFGKLARIKDVAITIPGF